MSAGERRVVIGGTDVTDRIRQLVDAAPPLSQDQRARIAMLFRDSARPLGIHPRIPTPAKSEAPVATGAAATDSPGAVTDAADDTAPQRTA